MFVTSGPLDPEQDAFFGREGELQKLERWLREGDCVGAVAGARQTGKTSLLLQLKQRLGEKYAFVFVDLMALQHAADGGCFAYLCREIVDQLHLTDLAGRVPCRDCDGAAFQGFLREVAAATGAIRIGVLLDEIGALEKDTGSMLASVIRSVFSSRTVHREYARFVFILSGSTDIHRFANDQSSPIYNVTERLYLGDLAPDAAGQLLAAGFAGLQPLPPAAAAERIVEWTGGHPYLTQSLGERFAAAWSAVRGTEPWDGVVQVDRVVETLLQTEDKNLPHLRRSLDKLEPRAKQILRRVMAGERVRFSRSDDDLAELELTGALRVTPDGACAVRNRIYERTIVAWLHEQDPPAQPPAPPKDRIPPAPLWGLAGFLLTGVAAFLSFSAIRCIVKGLTEAVLVLLGLLVSAAGFFFAGLLAPRWREAIRVLIGGAATALLVTVIAGIVAPPLAPGSCPGEEGLVRSSEAAVIAPAPATAAPASGAPTAGAPVAGAPVDGAPAGGALTPNASSPPAATATAAPTATATATVTETATATATATRPATATAPAVVATVPLDLPRYTAKMVRVGLPPDGKRLRIAVHVDDRTPGQPGYGPFNTSFPPNDHALFATGVLTVTAVAEGFFPMGYANEDSEAEVKALVDVALGGTRDALTLTITAKAPLYACDAFFLTQEANPDLPADLVVLDLGLTPDCPMNRE